MSRHPNPSRPKDNRPPKRDPKPPFDKKSKPAPKSLDERIDEWAAREVAKMPPITREEVATLLVYLGPGIEAFRRARAA